MVKDDKIKKSEANGVKIRVGENIKNSNNDKGTDPSIGEAPPVVQVEQGKRGRRSVNDVSKDEINLLDEFRKSTSIETDQEVKQIDLKTEPEFNFLTGQLLLLVMNNIFPTVLVLLVNLLLNKQIEVSTIQFDETEIQTLQASADEYAIYLNSQLGNSPFTFPVTVLVMYLMKLLTTW